MRKQHIYNNPKAFNFQFSIFNFQFSIFNFQLPKVFNFQFSIFNLPKFSIFNFQFSILGLFLLLTACQRAQVPTQYTQSDALPSIYPDYIGVTVPVNIAPLAFQYVGQVDDAVARFSAADEQIVCQGEAQNTRSSAATNKPHFQFKPDIDDWHTLCQAAKGKAIQVEVYTQKAGQWTRTKPFNIYVAADSIDPYISYRLISPSYVTYEELTINQRCLENYQEGVIYDNMLCGDEVNGQCINCHNYQAYNPEHFQFHARQKNGGTLIAYDGKLTKVNLKTDSTISAGVYPAWHPFLKLIAYSTNTTMQSFHTTDLNKIEVLDSQSDLIAYDLEHNEVTTVDNEPNEFEIFPHWSPDGKWLYYCSAHFEYENDTISTSEAIKRSKEIKYNIYRKSFDLTTHQFGPRELVFDAVALDKSATLPRVSPDGKRLLFTLGGWGCFHIWHRDADLWTIDLATLQAQPLTGANSDNVESYHSWSSNGKWIIFSSRRTDGVFTRPFIAYIQPNGNASKPFELPSADPDYHRQLMKSYNIPEFMRGPVNIKPQDFAAALKKDAQQATYVQKLR